MHENHGTAADYFAVGIVAHEIMLRRKPWPADDRKTYKEAVVRE
jgi:hypothetical protein